ncbi:VWA domain-containing protein [Candidatus Woesearchaeota archaeon]|nr:VWA domain-containing protein [Candidatus Woesearchaeota archaeon]
MSLAFQEPRALVLIIPLAVAAVFIITRQPVRFASPMEKIRYYSSRRGYRIFLISSRIMLIIALLLALADPFTVTSRTVVGDPKLTILVDESDSMQVLDTGVVAQLKAQLEQQFPVEVKTIGAGTTSPLGDSILSNIRGQDSSLLVSDANSNFGRSLLDIMMFASQINSTINALSLNTKADDTSVQIIGPARTTADFDNKFLIIVNQTGSRQDYTLQVRLDGSSVYNAQKSGGFITEFQRRLPEGYHSLEATITIQKDLFPQNNVFYKTVKVEPKPKILYIAKESSSPMLDVLRQLYIVTSSSSLPAEFNQYSAVVLNDYPLDELSRDHVDRLRSYVLDGNGLYVIGGKESFDTGTSKSDEQKLFESMLPVQVGQGTREQKKDVNVVIALDISQSGGQGFWKNLPDVQGVTDVGKALAISISRDIRRNDNLGVIAFNSEAYVISPMTKKEQKPDLEEQIARLQNSGITYLYAGIDEARKLLRTTQGSKYIILITDGNTITSPVDTRPETYRSAKDAEREGIKIFTVGFDNEITTNGDVLRKISEFGDGSFFLPDERHRIKLAFGPPDPSEPDEENLGISILNGHHFITESVEPFGKVSGFNVVVPKSNAQLLVTSANGDPLMSVWRFGLGRVVVLSTDDGRAWAQDLLNKRNSVLIARSVNWAVGDLNRKKEFDVDIRDVSLPDQVEINVKSTSLPNAQGLSFYKSDENLYTAHFSAGKPGIYDFLGAKVAVNSYQEYQQVGQNPSLDAYMSLTGGKVFRPDEVQAIADKVRQDSITTQTRIRGFRWLLLIIAIAVLLIEILFRRIIEDRLKNKSLYTKNLAR